MDADPFIIGLWELCSVLWMRPSDKSSNLVA